MNELEETQSFSVAVFLVGVITLGIGLWRGEHPVTVVGGVASAMFYPPMRLARRIREQNMAIILLEIPWA